jgi:hypothetical protein
LEISANVQEGSFIIPSICQKTKHYIKDRAIVLHNSEPWFFILRENKVVSKRFEGKAEEVGNLG